MVNPLIAILKPQSNGPSYSNTAIGTLAVDGWAVTFGTAMRGLGGQTSYYSMCHYNCLWSLKVKHYCNRQSNQCAPTTRHITQHSTQCQLSMSWRHVRKHHLMQTSYDRTYCHLSSALFAVHRPAVLSRLYTYSSYSPRILSQHIQFWTDRQCYLESINADRQTDRQTVEWLQTQLEVARNHAALESCIVTRRGPTCSGMIKIFHCRTQKKNRTFCDWLIRH